MDKFIASAVIAAGLSLSSPTEMDYIGVKTIPELRNAIAGKVYDVCLDYNKNPVGCFIETLRINSRTFGIREEETREEEIQEDGESSLFLYRTPEVPLESTFKKKIAEIKGSPLDMKGITGKDTLRQFLGLNQYKEILEKYNGDVMKQDKKGNVLDGISLYKQDEITIPRIFDGLEEDFGSTLEDFLVKHPEFQKDIGTDTTVLVLTKVSNDKFALAFYKEGQLSLATHVSPGLPSPPTVKTRINKKTGKKEEVTIAGGVNTPSGKFLAENMGLRFKRSIEFEDSPMPYSIWVTGGTFLHHGANVDGRKRSHGCIRVPGFYQEILYHEITGTIKTVIKHTEEKK